jgi:hypothetical protein
VDGDVGVGVGDGEVCGAVGDVDGLEEGIVGKFKVGGDGGGCDFKEETGFEVELGWGGGR